MAWADETAAIKLSENAIFFNIICENGAIFVDCKFIMSNRVICFFILQMGFL